MNRGAAVAGTWIFRGDESAPRPGRGGAVETGARLRYEAAFRNSLKKYGKDSTWQVAFDMDEYPVAPEDTAPGFLCRAVKTFSDAHPDASELSLKNFARPPRGRGLAATPRWRRRDGNAAVATP